MKTGQILFLITRHFKLGIIIEACLVKNINNHFEVLEKINEPDDFPKPVQEIINLIQSYSEKQLFRVYGRNSKNVNDFINKLNDVLYNEQIKPFIERRLDLLLQRIAEGGFLLAFRSGHSNIIFEDDLLDISSIPIHPVFTFTKTETSIQYQVDFFRNDQPFDFTEKKITVITNAPCYFLYDQVIYKIENFESKKLMLFTRQKVINIPLASENEYLEKFILPCVRQYDTRLFGFWVHETVKPDEVKLKVSADLKGCPAFELYFKYGRFPVKPTSVQKTIADCEPVKNHIQINIFRRDFVFEHGIKEWLIESGLNTNDEFFYYPRAEFALNYEQQLQSVITWINNNESQLKEQKIQTDTSFIEATYYIGKTQLEISKTEHPDWFDLYGTIVLDEIEIPVIMLKDHILQNIRIYNLPSGKKMILPDELFGKFRELLRMADTRQNLIRILKKRIDAGTIESIIATDTNLNFSIQGAQLGEMHKKDLPQGLKGTLRHYQEYGYWWLSHLSAAGLGGCLADDMGLGKTVQAICMLLEAKNSGISLKKSKIPKKTRKKEEEPSGEIYLNASLVVMPLSLLHNWKNEIKKFAPSLSVIIHQGGDRSSKLETFYQYDVVLTTYGTMRNDIALFSQPVFRYIILDESQYIKNHRSLTYKALAQLKATNRFTLTGTPIENSLSDLWSQLNFVIPGFLGNYRYFHSNYILPVELHNNHKKVEELRTITEKFILRRTKEEVEPDLPPLDEQTVYCSFDPEQKTVYETAKSEARNRIWASINEKGMKKSTFVILESMLRLRQIANHPVLIDETLHAGSGKYEQIKDSIANITSNGHKVLVFSSFVTHLNLIKKHLESTGIGYSMITGQTTRREQEIDDFNDNTSKKVFLLSIKAAGTGLNLTAADYVMILEPWWNPAVEAQALSRAHRIGQTKKVIVLRFITAGSIEEKILQLQEKKKKLAREIISESDFMKQLSEEDMSDLFAMDQENAE